MSITTIHCRLVASEKIRRQLWNVMTTKNTPLVNELLQQISQHPEFEDWLRKGDLPEKAVRDLCEPLKVDPRFNGQPGRLFTSASLMATYAYKSWLALQQKRQLRLDGKCHWLNIVKSDVELMEICKCDLTQIRAQADAILTRAAAKLNPNENQPTQSKKKKKSASTEDATLMSFLFKEYENTKDVLAQCAIAYLLKNDCKVVEQPEDVEAFTKRIHKKQVEIDRLEEQLKSRLPKGRNLTGEAFLEALEIARTQLPEDEAEQARWFAKLLTKASTLPYPVTFGSQSDFDWSKNKRGRICVCFNGFRKHFNAVELDSFQIYCGRRQLLLFERFLADWQAHKADKEDYPLSLTILRSGMLLWEEGDGKGELWNVNHLKLQCTLDTGLLTAEGTELVRQQKIAEVSEKLASIKDESHLIPI